MIRLLIYHFQRMRKKKFDDVAGVTLGTLLLFFILLFHNIFTCHVKPTSCVFFSSSFRQYFHFTCVSSSSSSAIFSFHVCLFFSNIFTSRFYSSSSLAIFSFHVCLFLTSRVYYSSLSSPRVFDVS